MIKFYYRKEISSVTGTVKRPVADVVLQSVGFKIEAALYIDSGADITMIPLGMGKALGLRRHPEDEIREIKGVSGVCVPYILKKIVLILDGKRLIVRAAWVLVEEVPLLMGRLDIFPKFKITFNEKKETISFRS